MSRLTLGVFLLVASSTFAAEEPVTLRYLRPSKDSFDKECEFQIASTKDQWSIRSTTFRGTLQLTIESKYSIENQLREASVGVTSGDKVEAASLAVKDRIAVLQLPDGKQREFDAKAGVIVTSAPDWTDTFMLCVRYDRTKGGKQEFPGLWIHPRQPSRAATFHVENVGADTIEHGDANKKITLHRYAIRLRAGSDYTAWVTDNGEMIKLVPMPANPKAKNWLVRDGYQRSVANLWPPAEKPKSGQRRRE